MAILLVFLGGSTGIACIIGAETIWRLGADPSSANPGIGAAFVGCFLQVLFGLLILSAVAPMALSEERQRGSLDLLAATTLSTRVIVVGKWLGTFRLILFWTLGPATDLDLEQRRLQPAATDFLRTGAGRPRKPELVARWTTDRVRYALSRESEHDHGDRFRRRRTQTANRARTDGTSPHLVS